PDPAASVLVKMLNHRLCRQHVIDGDVTDLIGKLEGTLDHHERRSTLQQLVYQRVMGTSRSDDQAIHQTVLLQDALKELLFVLVGLSPPQKGCVITVQCGFGDAL